METTQSRPSTKISGKLLGAILALFLGLILAITYPSKKSGESSVASETLQSKPTRSSVEIKEHKTSPAKKTKRPVVIQHQKEKEEEEEGC